MDTVTEKTRLFEAFQNKKTPEEILEIFTKYPQVDVHSTPNHLFQGKLLYWFLEPGHFSVKITQEFAELFPYINQSKEFWLHSNDRRFKKKPCPLDYFIEGHFFYAIDWFSANYPTSLLEAVVQKEVEDISEFILYDPSWERDVTDFLPNTLAFKWEKNQVEPFRIFTIQSYGKKKILVTFPTPQNSEENGASHVFLIQIKRYLKNTFDFNSHLEK